MKRKAQAEDIFGDITISLILIIIAVIMISINSKDYEQSVSAIKYFHQYQLRGIDVITLARMPVSHPVLEEHGYKDINFAKLFELIAKNYPEKNPQLEWILEKEGFAKTKLLTPSLTCRENFVNLINQNLGHFQWDLRIYGEKNKNLIFECEQISVPQESIYMEKELHGEALEAIKKFSPKTNITIPFEEAGDNIIIEMVIAE